MKKSRIKSVALGSASIILDLQRRDFQIIDCSDTYWLQVEILVINLQSHCFPLGRQFVENADRRSVHVTKHVHAAGFANRHRGKLSTIHVFKTIFSLVNTDLRLVRIYADVCELEVVWFQMLAVAKCIDGFGILTRLHELQLSDLTSCS